MATSKTYLSLLFFCLSFTFLFAQNTKIQLTKAVKAGQQNGFDIYKVQFKVLSGEAKNRSEFTLLDNGVVKGYAQLESYSEPLTPGQATKFEEMIYVLGGSIAAGQTLVSHDLAQPTLAANRPFGFTTSTAFLGNSSTEFMSSISEVKGTIKVGDAIEYQNAKGERSKAKITRIDVGQTLHPIYLIEGLPKDTYVSVTIESESKVDFSNAKVTSVGGLGGASTNPASANTKTAKVTGKTQKIPVNVTLKNDEVKITVHNLIKFNPDPAASQYDVIKVDYSLDYYIVDATFENISNHAIDAGEYLLRFNFFSADGKSADEFLRLFKKEKGANDEAKQQADLVDKMVLGGTSKIKSAGVLVKYQEMIPDYEQNHKPIVEKLSKMMAPQQQLHSIVATILAVPPTYKIEGVGTWKGTFFSQKNFIFAPVSK
ncbi:MAG: hypothetical protein LCH91_09890 [Bacteroidetes bacterium]|nr:hypothetical protein [Bacteroidota bacterium]